MSAEHEQTWHEERIARLEARIAEQRGIIEEHAVTIAVQYRNLQAAEADLLLAAQQNTALSERLDRLEGALAEGDEG